MTPARRSRPTASTTPDRKGHVESGSTTVTDNSTGVTTQSVTVNVKPVVSAGDTEPVESKGTTTVVLRSDVLFRFGSHALADPAKAEIKRAAAVLEAGKATSVFVAGHADSRGLERDNLRLADQRARRGRRLSGGAVPQWRAGGHGDSARGVATAVL